MTIGPAPICLFCARFNTNSAWPVTCTAFPTGIPDQIFVYGYDHRNRYPGDLGLTFTIEHGKEAGLAEWSDLHARLFAS